MVGFSPIVLLTRCDYIGESFSYHQEFLPLQSMFPPKYFGNFLPEGGCSEDLDAFNFFLDTTSQPQTFQMSILLVVTKRYEGQRVTSWWQLTPRTNRDPNHDKTLARYNIEGNLHRLGLLSSTHSQRSQQQSGQITLQSVLINKPKLL